MLALNEVLGSTALWLVGWWGVVRRIDCRFIQMVLFGGVMTSGTVCTRDNIVLYGHVIYSGLSMRFLRIVYRRTALIDRHRKTSIQMIPNLYFILAHLFKEEIVALRTS